MIRFWRKYPSVFDDELHELSKEKLESILNPPKS